MLWETADAAQALRDRFGLDSRKHAVRWLAQVLDEHWDLAVQDVPRLALSDRNAIAWVRTDRGPLIVKLSCAQERFAHLAATTRLITGLASQGIPVAAPLPDRDGRVRLETEGPSAPLSLAVLPEVAGVWLDATDLDAVHAAGACLAALHGALAHVEDTTLPTTAPRPLPARISTWLADHDPGRAPEASAHLSALLADLPALEEPPQLIHGDYRAANLLVKDGLIAAVLDFDEVRTDHRIVDLAQASIYLATLFRDWGPTPAPARAALRSGYESVRPLSPLEADWLEALTLWMGIAAIPPGDDGRWAAAVGVSPRTFFRHYPTKESAAYPGDTEFDALIDHVVTLLEQGAPLIQVLDGAWLSHFQQIDEQGKDPVPIIRERRLAESEPAVVVVGIQGGERLNARLADAARRAPGISSDDPTPMAVVAAIGSIAHVAYREWALQMEAGHTSSLRELYLRLRRGVGAYADDLTRIDDARIDDARGTGDATQGGPRADGPARGATSAL